MALANGEQAWKENAQEAIGLTIQQAIGEAAIVTEWVLVARYVDDAGGSATIFNSVASRTGVLGMLAHATAVQQGHIMAEEINGHE